MRTGFEINFLELYHLKYNVLCTDYNNLVENPVNFFSEAAENFDGTNSHQRIIPTKFHLQACFKVCKGSCHLRFSGFCPLRGGGYPPIPLRKKSAKERLFLA